MFQAIGIILIIVFSIYLISRHGELERDAREFRLLLIRKHNPKLNEYEVEKRYKRDYGVVASVDGIMVVVAVIGVFLLLMG